MALRYFNAAGADPDGQIGEAHDPETHLIPLVLAAARSGRPVRIFGTDYKRRWQLRTRLHPRNRYRGRTRARTGISSRRRAVLRAEASKCTGLFGQGGDSGGGNCTVGIRRAPPRRGAGIDRRSQS
jgi:hypothetical protein